MMLLQAGQLGLYRKDSIWTSEIPPDMVAGATCWLDFTDTATLFDGYSYDGGNVTTHGAAVISARDNLNLTRGLSYGVPPVLVSPATPSGGTSALYQGSGTGVDSVHYAFDAFTGTNPPISTLVTSTTKQIIVAMKVSSAQAATGYVYDAAISIGDHGEYLGIKVTEDAGVLTAHAYNWAGGPTSSAQNIPRDTWVVVTMSHQSGQLRCRVNGGAWASSASGATDVMDGFLYVRAKGGGGGVLAGKFEVAHIVTGNTTQTDAALSAVEHWIANDVGITPWW